MSTPWPGDWLHYGKLLALGKLGRGYRDLSESLLTTACDPTTFSVKIPTGRGLLTSAKGWEQRQLMFLRHAAHAPGAGLRGDTLGQTLSPQLSPRRPAQRGPDTCSGDRERRAGLHITHVSPSWGASRTHATQCHEGSRIRSRGLCLMSKRNQEPRDAE